MDHAIWSHEADTSPLRLRVPTILALDKFGARLSFDLPDGTHVLKHLSTERDLQKDSQVFSSYAPQDH